MSGGLKLITRIGKNTLMLLEDRYRLFKRGVIESVFNIMMTVFDLEHTCHHRAQHGLTHLFATIAAYSLLDQQPTVLLPRQLT